MDITKLVEQDVMDEREKICRGLVKLSSSTPVCLENRPTAAQCDENTDLGGARQRIVKISKTRFRR